MTLLMAKTLPTVDFLIRDAHIVTMDDNHTILPKASIAIQDGKISAIISDGTVPDARQILDGSGKVAMPGLVNGHAHSAMALFRGIADDLPLSEWLNHHIFPAEAALVTPDFVRLGVSLAACEMIRSGTTLFSDMYYFQESTAEVIRAIGMKAVLAEAIVGFPTPRAKTPHESIRAIEAFIAKWKGDPWITPGIAPHAIYTCSPDVLQAAAALSERSNLPLHIHLSETAEEVETSFKKNGCSPVAHLSALGVLSSRTTAAHCVHLSDADIELMAAAGAHVIHNPESNMKLASGIAPISKYLRRGINVALGTDGAASNNNLDLFEEMRTAALLQKVATGDPTVMNAREVLRMATRGGAGALGLDQKTGSLQAGKSADIILVNMAQSHLLPLYNVESHLVYAAKGSDVTDVMVEGKLLMRNRTLTTIDEEKVLRDASEVGAAIARHSSSSGAGSKAAIASPKDGKR